MQSQSHNPDVILASSSVYRKLLLERLKLDFVVLSPDIDERPLEQEAPEQALRAIDRGAELGCFAIRIQSRDWRLRLGGRLQSLRSRVLLSATGDQAIFVRADVFEDLGGFHERLELCEDLDFVRRFGAGRDPARFAFVDEPVKTSARRWESSGVSTTIGLMWALRLGYHLGVSPNRLSQYYRARR